jgi:YidC/Oxa1 family membrane protein insertase
MPVVFANVLQPLIDLTESIMVFIHDHVVASWGLAIIGLTVVVRLVLLPLTLRQFKSMQALQRLQPEIKALQAKYKDDKQRLNQEMMKFYQENKVNPLGSCLPLIAQLPVFISLFYMLRTDLKHDICPGIVPYAAEVDKSVTNLTCSQFSEATGGPARGDWSFGFIPDLTAKATGAVLITLIVLYVGSQLASSLLMTVSADKSQRRMMIALPLIFVAFVINFPAGLLVYWITTNFWTIVQQYIVRKTVGPIRPPATETAGGGGAGGTPAKPDDGGGGGGGLSGLARAFRPSSDAGNGDGAAAEKDEKPKRETAPPPPPRKKKKARSGRRR